VFKERRPVRNLAQAMKEAAFAVAVALGRTRRSAVFHKSIATPNARCAGEVMRRTLIWIDEQRFSGWGCSECACVFNPSGPPTGESLDEMKQSYERQRDKDFAAHVCAGHPRTKKVK
jgi:hypothetical protein